MKSQAEKRTRAMISVLTVQTRAGTFYKKVNLKLGKICLRANGCGPSAIIINCDSSVTNLEGMPGTELNA